MAPSPITRVSAPDSPLPRQKGCSSFPHPRLPRWGVDLRPSHPFPGEQEGRPYRPGRARAHLPGSLALRFQNCLPLSAAMAEGRGGPGRPASGASEPTGRPAPRRSGGARRKAAAPRRPPHRRPPAASGGAILGAGGESAAIGRFGQGVPDQPMAS